jgi:hypothetical protein
MISAPVESTMTTRCLVARIFRPRWRSRSNARGRPAESTCRGTSRRSSAPRAGLGPWRDASRSRSARSRCCRSPCAGCRRHSTATMVQARIRAAGAFVGRHGKRGPEKKLDPALLSGVLYCGNPDCPADPDSPVDRHRSSQANGDREYYLELRARVRPLSLVNQRNLRVHSGTAQSSPCLDRRYQTPASPQYHTPTRPPQSPSNSPFTSS